MRRLSHLTWERKCCSQWFPGLRFRLLAIGKTRRSWMCHCLSRWHHLVQATIPLAAAVGTMEITSWAKPTSVSRVCNQALLTRTLSNRTSHMVRLSPLRSYWRRAQTSSKAVALWTFTVLQQHRKLQQHWKPVAYRHRWQSNRTKTPQIYTYQTSISNG